MTRTIEEHRGVKYLELNRVDPGEFEAFDKQGVGWMEGVPTTFMVKDGVVRLWPVPKFPIKIRILVDL